MKQADAAAPTPGTAPVKTRFFYGWVIVAVAGLGLFFSGPGQTYSVSAFIDSYIAEYGWSRSLVSSFYSIATLMAGLLLPFVGRMVDRVGQRAVSVAIGTMLGLACFWNSAISGAVMLFAGFFMLRLFGQGSMSLLPSTLVPQWFISKRGRALSFMAVGGFISSAFFPPANAWLIANWGWRTAWTTWGFALLVIFVPLSYFLIRNKPEDIGLLPDGVCEDTAVKPTDTGPTTAAFAPAREVSWTLPEALKTRAFWLILFCVGVPAMVDTGMVFHLVSILGHQGLDITAAALVLSVVAMVGFPTSFLVGFMVERVSARYVLAAGFAGNLVYLMLIQHINTLQLAIGVGILWGLVAGIYRIVFNYIWPDYYGREHLGSIRGLAMTAGVIASALGPLPFGIAYDFFGGYTEIIYIMMLFPALAAVAALAASKPSASQLQSDRASNADMAAGH